jgi:hypothetical protein
VGVRFGIGVGFGTVLVGALLGVVLAPLVLGVIAAVVLLLGAAATLGAVTGRRIRVSPRVLSNMGWAITAVIPTGLCVAFFGHADETAVEVGLYAALAAVPTSTALIAASVFVTD